MEGGADAPAVWQLTQATDSSTMRVAWTGVASKRILGALARTQQRRQKLDTHTQRAVCAGRAHVARVRLLYGTRTTVLVSTISDPGGSRAGGARARARVDYPTWAYRVWYREMVETRVVRVSTEIAIHTAIWYSQPCRQFGVADVIVRI